MSASPRWSGHDSDFQFAAYKQFCDTSSVEKERAIEERTETIEALKADICMYKSDAETLTKETAQRISQSSAAPRTKTSMLHIWGLGGLGGVICWGIGGGDVWEGRSVGALVGEGSLVGEMFGSIGGG